MPRAAHRPAVVVGLDDVRAYLRRAARTLERHARFLDRLDAALGDGDHGENMLLGFRSVTEALATDPGTDIGELLRRVGHTLVASVGGASGPLYGTAFIEAGFAARGATELDAGDLATALEAAVRGLARRGRCSPGDKTILDALGPAATAVRGAAEVGAPIGPALVDAARAAREGMRATTPMIARRGLALRLGERSRGHQDPGATSCFLLFRAMLPDRRAEPADPRDGTTR